MIKTVFFIFIILIPLVSAFDEQTTILSGDNECMLAFSQDEQLFFIGKQSPAVMPSQGEYRNVEIKNQSINQTEIIEERDICTWDYWGDKKFMDYNFKEMGLCLSRIPNKLGNSIWPGNSIAGFIILVLLSGGAISLIFYIKKKRKKSPEDENLEQGEIRETMIPGFFVEE